MALIECRECGAEVSTSAKRCPKCGAEDPMPFKQGLVRDLRSMAVLVPLGLITTVILVWVAKLAFNAMLAGLARNAVK